MAWLLLLIAGAIVLIISGPSGGSWFAYFKTIL